MWFFDVFGKSNPETPNIPSPNTKASLGELWNNIKKPSENNTHLESIKDYVGKGSENQDVFYIVVAGADGVFTTIKLTKIWEKVFEFSTKDKNKYNLTFRDGVWVNQQFSTSLPTGYRVHGMVFPVTTQYAWQHKSNSPYTYVPYTPYEPMLNSPEKRKQGLEYLKTSFARAHEAIQQKNIPSQAFRGKKVHEVIPPWLPMMFNIVEHMDSDIYIGNQKTDTLKPRSETWKIMDDKIGEVFYQYSANKWSAYNYSKSGAWALGTAQIMPKPYEVLSHDHYPKAWLNPSFIAGMQDHQNAMMTQILWFDDILKTFPDEFKEEYLKWINWKKPNIDIAGILGASYNSGTSISAKLRKWQQWDTIFDGLRIESQIYFHKTRYVRQQLGKEYGTAIPDSPNVAQVGLEYQDESIIAARLKRKIPKWKKQSPELAREQAEMGHYPAYKTYEDIERGLKNSKLILVSPSWKGYALTGIWKRSS
jgi:hypothetical protein